MHLIIGGVPIPPLTLVDATAAVDFAQGLHAASSLGANRLTFATVSEADASLPHGLFACVHIPAAGTFDVDRVAPVALAIVAAETAADLDALFAGTDRPAVAVSDGTTIVTVGRAQLRQKRLLKGCGATGEQLWLYAVRLSGRETYRFQIQRRMVFSWRDVMLDTYPAEGEPVTAGPTLFDGTADVLYPYCTTGTLYYGGTSNASVYGVADVQLDSGCRYALSLEQYPAGGPAWRVRRPRFWTLSESRRVAESQWSLYSDRIIFGGRVPVGELAGNLPKSLVIEYQLPGSPPPPPATYTLTTGAVLGGEAETQELGGVHSAAAISAQAQTLYEWEVETRRNFRTVFAGLVPWVLTPIDCALEYRWPCDGVQEPCTVLYGRLSPRNDDGSGREVANPAPSPNAVTVTFIRPAFPDPLYNTEPAGFLTRVGQGSSPPFVPPSAAGLGETVSYLFQHLPDGTYSSWPGSPWSPTSDSVSVAGGSSATMTFTLESTGGEMMAAADLPADDADAVVYLEPFDPIDTEPEGMA